MFQSQSTDRILSSACETINAADQEITHFYDTRSPITVFTRTRRSSSPCAEPSHHRSSSFCTRDTATWALSKTQTSSNHLVYDLLNSLSRPTLKYPLGITLILLLRYGSLMVYGLHISRTLYFPPLQCMLHVPPTSPALILLPNNFCHNKKYEANYIIFILTLLLLKKCDFISIQSEPQNLSFSATELCKSILKIHCTV